MQRRRGTATLLTSEPRCDNFTITVHKQYLLSPAVDGGNRHTRTRANAQTRWTVDGPRVTFARMPLHVLLVASCLLAQISAPAVESPAPPVVQPLAETRDATLASILGWAFGASAGVLPAALLTSAAMVAGFAGGYALLDALIANTKPGLGAIVLILFVVDLIIAVVGVVLPAILIPSLVILSGNAVATMVFATTSARFPRRHMWPFTTALISSVLPCALTGCACLCPITVSAPLCGVALFTGNGLLALAALFLPIVTPIPVALCSLAGCLFIRPATQGLLLWLPVQALDEDAF